MAGIASSLSAPSRYHGERLALDPESEQIDAERNQRRGRACLRQQFERLVSRRDASPIRSSARGSRRPSASMIGCARSRATRPRRIRSSALEDFRSAHAICSVPQSQSSGVLTDRINAIEPGRPTSQSRQCQRKAEASRCCRRSSRSRAPRHRPGTAEERMTPEARRSMSPPLPHNRRSTPRMALTAGNSATTTIRNSSAGMAMLKANSEMPVMRRRRNEAQRDRRIAGRDQREHRNDDPHCAHSITPPAATASRSADPGAGWHRELKAGTARGTFALAHSRPPCASMIERQIDSPMPKPSGFVV